MTTTNYMTGMNRAQPTDRPSSLRAWSAVASIALGAFVIVTTEFLPVGFLPRIAGDLDVSLGAAGLMVLVPGLGAAASASLLLVGARHLDRRYVITGLGALVALSNAVAAIAPSFSVVLVGRLLLGVAIGGFWTVVPPTGSRLVGARHNTRANSIMVGGVSAGTVFGLPAGQFLGSVLGWRWTFGAVAVVALVIAVVQFVLLPSVPPEGRARFRDIGSVLRIPMVRTAIVVTIVVFVGQFASSTFITPFLLSSVQLNSGQVTTLFLAYGVAGIVGTLAGGPLVAKSQVGTLAGAAIILGGTLVLLPVLSTHGAAIATLTILWGLIWGVVPLAAQMWILNSAPHAQEPAAAVNVTTMQISIAAGSAVGGLLVDSAGVPAVYTIGGAIAVVAGLSAITLGRMRSRRATISGQ